MLFKLYVTSLLDCFLYCLLSLFAVGVCLLTLNYFVFVWFALCKMIIFCTYIDVYSNIFLP